MKTPIKLLAILFAANLIIPQSFAQPPSTNPNPERLPPNILDELDPFAPDIQETLNKLDEDYEAETGKPAIDPSFLDLFLVVTCNHAACPVYAVVDKSEQRLRLYLNGQLQGSWPTSTGVANGHWTPNMDKHPDGRIYDRYTSHAYPGGDWNGLGNMPYAVFIRDGFAIHGTGQSNWPYLGTPASHGCIRIHPNNAFVFNRLVRQYGVNSTWVTVQE